MAATDIELYEALKKDVSEEAARMIAEAVPKAENIATKDDVLNLGIAIRAEITKLVQRVNALELYIERRFADAERRTFRYSMIFGAPLWAAMVAALVKFVVDV